MHALSSLLFFSLLLLSSPHLRWACKASAFQQPIKHRNTLKQPITVPLLTLGGLVGRAPAFLSSTSDALVVERGGEIEVERSVSQHTAPHSTTHRASLPLLVSSLSPPYTTQHTSQHTRQHTQHHTQGVSPPLFSLTTGARPHSEHGSSLKTYFCIYSI